MRFLSWRSTLCCAAHRSVTLNPHVVDLKVSQRYWLRRTTYVMIVRRACTIWSKLRYICAYKSLVNVLICAIRLYYIIYIYIYITYKNVRYFVLCCFELEILFWWICAVPCQLDWHEYKHTASYWHYWSMLTHGRWLWEVLVILWWLWILKGLSVRVKGMDYVLCVKSKSEKLFIRVSLLRCA